MRSPAAAPAVAAALGSAALLGGAAPARADSEQAISVSVGWATFSALDPAPEDMEPSTLAPSIGGSLGVSYERMIGTDLGLRGELVGGLFYGGGDDGGASNALLADAGATVRFDVLRYVPYAFAGLGAVTTGGGPLARGSDLVLVLGGGIDWLQSRSRSYGAEVRLASFAGDVTVVTVGLRATTRWGFF